MVTGPPDILGSPERRNPLGDWLAPRAAAVPRVLPALRAAVRAVRPWLFTAAVVTALGGGLAAGWILGHHLR